MDTKKIYIIFARYMTGEIEKLDEADSYDDAKYLVGEYQIAFQGQGIDILVR